jgi:hypothetical protein
MKKIVLLLLFTGFLHGNIYGQSKQREELLKQIVALKTYIGYAQKGYSIAKKGLNTISNFKRGEFNLHEVYFNSLKKINPNIKSYARVSQIILLQVKVVESYKSTLRQVQQNDLFHGDEIAYIKRVLERLIENCVGTLAELSAIVTEGKLEMKDDERMKRIDSLYQNMLESYTFCEDFSNQTKMMSLSRGKEATDIKTSRALQGFKNNLP